MSRIADEIVKEYKIRKAFEKRKRQVCRSQECKECNYFNICKEEGSNIEKNNTIP